MRNSNSCSKGLHSNSIIDCWNLCYKCLKELMRVCVCVLFMLPCWQACLWLPTVPGLIGVEWEEKLLSLLEWVSCCPQSGDYTLHGLQCFLSLIGLRIGQTLVQSHKTYSWPTSPAWQGETRCQPTLCPQAPLHKKSLAYRWFSGENEYDRIFGWWQNNEEGRQRNKLMMSEMKPTTSTCSISYYFHRNREKKGIG